MGGDRWHISCALKQVYNDIERLIEKQQRFDTKAGEYATLQQKIDNLIQDRDGLIRFMEEVPEQARQLGLIFIRGGDKLAKRDAGGRLLDGASDPQARIALPTERLKKLDKGGL